MTASPRDRELVKPLKAWRSLLASNHYQEKVELLDSVIATLEASATAPKGEAVACPQCGAPEGAICKSPFCVRLPPPSPKAEPNQSAVEEVAEAAEVAMLREALEAERRWLINLIINGKERREEDGTTVVVDLTGDELIAAIKARAALSGATHDR